MTIQIWLMHLASQPMLLRLTLVANAVAIYCFIRYLALCLRRARMR